MTDDTRRAEDLCRRMEILFGVSVRNDAAVTGTIADALRTARDEGLEQAAEVASPSSGDPRWFYDDYEQDRIAAAIRSLKSKGGE